MNAYVYVSSDDGSNQGVISVDIKACYSIKFNDKWYTVQRDEYGMFCIVVNNERLVVNITGEN